MLVDKIYEQNTLCLARLDRSILPQGQPDVTLRSVLCYTIATTSSNAAKEVSLTPLYRWEISSLEGLRQLVHSPIAGKWLKEIPNPKAGCRRVWREHWCLSKCCHLPWLTTALCLDDCWPLTLIVPVSREHQSESILTPGRVPERLPQYPRPDCCFVRTPIC